jgi:DNA-binding CsgD family transcriptional regulator
MNSHARQDLGRSSLPVLSETDQYIGLLSPRELQIFHMIIAGKGDRDIAAELGISFWTVRGHVQQIFNKTGAINRRELMARFIRPMQ